MKLIKAAPTCFGSRRNHHVARMGDRGSAHRVMVGRPEGKRPHGRPTRRWEENIKMELQDVELGGVDWIELAQDGQG